MNEQFGVLIAVRQSSRKYTAPLPETSSTNLSFGWGHVFSGCFTAESGVAILTLILKNQL